MATVLCGGLPSSLVDPLPKAELPSLQPLPVMLRLKVPSQRLPADHGGWNFLQYSFAFADNLPQESAVKKDAYAPPPVWQSSPTVRLSERSLQLCTENLGSETGTDVSEGDSIFSYVRNSEIPTVCPTAATRQRSGGRKVNPVRQIPPPLTTLRGAECLHVRIHRQEGRLVINSVKPPPKSPGRFHAERVDGRLRLSLIRAEDHFPGIDTPESRDRRQGYDGDKQLESQHDVKDQNPPARTDAGCIQQTTGKRYRADSEHYSDKHEDSLPAGEEDPQDHQGGEDKTEKLIQRSIVRIRCNDEENDHHHNHHHHHSHQNKMLRSCWEPLWVATS
ncbi:hypothetical protein SAY87_028212 [Trapa incisa]|uniref:FAF domain-containing protein n=1 Tax=Trapa incisa TaxID=236973 RepID=A0AAN7QRE3_9MYRT|nr:hypothetical protein SAY87_028212 [Trapa incisa]